MDSNTEALGRDKEGLKLEVHFKNVLEALAAKAFDRAYERLGRKEEDYQNIPPHLKKTLEKNWEANRNELR